METILLIFIIIGLIIFMSSPIWIIKVTEFQRAKTIKIGNIYIRYDSSRKNPFAKPVKIFKVLDKQDGYIQYEEFRSTREAEMGTPYWGDKRHISSKKIGYIVSWWDEYECWFDINEK